VLALRLRESAGKLRPGDVVKLDVGAGEVLGEMSPCLSSRDVQHIPARSSSQASATCTGRCAQPCPQRGELGVHPDPERAQLQVEHAGKVDQRRFADDVGGHPGTVSSAPLNVLTAVTRAQELLDTAREVLGDPDRRRRYDEAACLRRSRGGLGQPWTGIESAGMAPAGLGITGDLGGNAMGGLLEVTVRLGPWRRQNGHGAVPDVRGLF